MIHGAKYGDVLIPIDHKFETQRRVMFVAEDDLIFFVALSVTSRIAPRLVRSRRDWWEIEE